ncbi:MAG: DNA-directed RNA polymerase subunit alpha C-terminal domain-containing protein [Planctomycetota bacterium]|nr:DNA-directed RNA polymerase subunit alpha C-terminal domain-containing protein [Planctomycetota bacterium]
MQAPPVNAASEAAADPVDLANDPIPSFASLQAARGTVFRTRRSLDSFGMQIDALGREGEEGRRRGLGLWMVGRYEEAVEMLEAHSADDVASFTHANALMSLGRPAEAVGVFQRLSEAYADEPRPRAGWIEARLEAVLAETGDRDQAADAAAASCAEAPESFMASADGLYIQGRISELRRDRETAIDHYSAAREADPTHRRNLFRLAHLCERWGLDEQALEAYEGLAAIQPIDRKVLLNLGCLYEDLGRDQDAATCYDTVVRFDPTDRRARLYLEDARAGMDMYYDEDLERKEDRLNQILRIPITDFELSVRARNCLNKMNILTLGDLVKKTEQELLTYKNFGETSLNEIKEILGSKALRLGMAREEAVASIESHSGRRYTSGENVEAMNRSIAELELSIRARRTVEALGCLTLGDVVQHSEDELLGMPNFGVTSLQELKDKLVEHGLGLKQPSEHRMS